MKIGPPPRSIRSFARAEKLSSVYVVDSGQGYCKIGKADDPFDRFSSIQAHNWSAVTLAKYWWLPGKALALRVEKEAHEALSEFHHRGEWFCVSVESVIPVVERIINGTGARAITDESLEKAYQKRRDRYDSGDFMQQMFLRGR